MLAHADRSEIGPYLGASSAHTDRSEIGPYLGAGADSVAHQAASRVLSTNSEDDAVGTTDPMKSFRLIPTTKNKTLGMKNQVLW